MVSQVDDAAAPWAIGNAGGNSWKLNRQAEYEKSGLFNV